MTAFFNKCSTTVFIKSVPIINFRKKGKSMFTNRKHFDITSYIFLLPNEFTMGKPDEQRWYVLFETVESAKILWIYKLLLFG